ncbi:iron-siderophore ABC transporter substrate-binding protein [Nocardioides lianchengensis]|uniref:Iron complex transport system substrate-binding protein n=1 Tax=Nocardioides lianchengensis TaxID=1045774 RepID=A0A1G6NMF5_9ACTN|nr:iron-siderophore ABC transporter substrate-binding protein [Nocardioides lianchengensis]NYG10810.1 iron complex transport system substrate-binding protein [Nocardioides lianchengensis]SDC68574.1 iron complex transport system substrate-binding protein [Nocardioides lianchengensis]
MRRRPSLALALLGLLLSGSLVACGDGDSSSATDDPSTGPAVEGAQFPVTVPHQFGETTVAEQPERVVSVGYTEQDILLQLGVTPVAVTDWYGDQPFATWPWATELLGDAEPEVLSLQNGFEFEKIAALKPDLIVGTNAGMTAKDYELLAKIAPTITSVEGSTQYFSSWQDQTLQVARALGREADGQALVDEVEQKYADVAAAHPDWQGKSATFSQGGPYDGQLYVYPDGLSTDFLTELGFVMTPGLEEYAPEVGSQAEISAENVNLIDADVIVWATENPEQFDELQAFSTVSKLPAVAENRSVYTDEVLAGAIYFLTPLSQLYLIDRLTPMLEAAATGEAPREYPS